MIRHLCLCTTTLCLATVCFAADWPQWRGPNRDAHSAETGLLKEWPKDGPKLVWHVTNLDAGYSTPSVVGPRLYLLSNVGIKDEFVRALSTEDGKTLWSVRIGRVGNPGQKPPYPAARSTPTVEGDVLYSLGSDGDLVCLETADGKERWRKNLRTDFGGVYGEWAYAESPLIEGDLLICTPGGEKNTLVALNKKTGETVWTCPVPGGDAAGYASALAADIAGVRQIVQFVARGVIGVDAKTGAFLWRFDATGKGPANMTTPVIHDNLIYTGGGRSGGGVVKVSKSADGKWVAEQVYHDMKFPQSAGGAIRVGEYLYGSMTGGLGCVEFKTGTVKWLDKSISPASLCFADGRIYLHGENGMMALIEATADAYKERGRFSPPGQPERGNSKAWAHPVVTGGRLYLRDGPVLWCYDLKEAK